MHIITPCRNAAATIAETLESVISQSTLAPVRYHVQDGFSSDGTQEILLDYQERISADKTRYGHIDFSWISEQDVGMYDAIAKAVNRLNIPPGAFMGWINADDLLYPDSIRMIQEIERNAPDVEWIGGSSLVMDMHGTILNWGKKYSQYPRELLRHGLCDGLHWMFLQQEGTFWRKRIWDAVGGLNTRLRLAGDWDLWRRMAERTEYVQLPEPTGIFRKREGQLSAGDGYYAELDALLPKTERRKTLRGLLPRLSSLQTTTLHRNSDNGYTRKKEPLRLTWKNIIRLVFAISGTYRLLQLSKQIARLMNIKN